VIFHSNPIRRHIGAADTASSAISKSSQHLRSSRCELKWCGDYPAIRTGCFASNIIPSVCLQLTEGDRRSDERNGTTAILFRLSGRK
jgi:hypothetical protein